MNRLKFKIMSIALATVLLLTSAIVGANAVTLYTDGSYTFADVDEDYVALYDFDNSSDTLIVPDSFKSREVNSIYDYAFQDNSTIRAIDFSQCSKHFTSIGARAFSGCSTLSGTLKTPTSVRNLGFACFENTGFTRVELNGKSKTIPAQAFNKCSKLEEVYLPRLTESIENLAFANCPELKYIYIPSSVTSISESAFKNSDNAVFDVYADSYAYEYAKSHNISYELLNPTLGDANNDGSVDVRDVTAIQKYKAGLIKLTRTGIRAADVTGDGEVSVRDATQIQRYLANIITDF